MPNLHELSDAMGAVRTSLPFAFALPLLVALAFASVVDWIERRLSKPEEGTAQDPVDARDASPRRSPLWGLEPARQNLIQADGRSHKHA
jgi:hypothetical protein